jgi:hypothetical protein
MFDAKKSGEGYLYENDVKTEISCCSPAPIGIVRK